MLNVEGGSLPKATSTGKSRRRCLVLFLILVSCLVFVCLVLCNCTGNRHLTSDRRVRVKSEQSTFQCEAPRSWTGSFEKVRRLPRAIVAGIRKGGTRALLNMIRLHPCVKANRKELHFFDRNATWRQGINWYQNQFPPTSGFEVAIEKSPAYFVTREVPARMKQSLPDVKIIVLLRNPVERLISDFMQLVSKERSQDALDLKTLSKKEIEDLEAAFKKRHFVTNRDGELEVRKDYFSVRLGVYHEFLERWWDYFPKNQVKVICAERFVRSPATVMEDLSVFMGLPRGGGFRWQDQIQFSKRKGFYCPKRRHHPNCLGASKGRQHIRPSPGLLKLLYDYYAQHNEILFRMLEKRCYWSKRGRAYNKQMADPESLFLEQ